MTSKAIPAVIGIVLTAAYTAAVFHLGSNNGAAGVQEKWDAESKRRDRVSAELKQKNDDLSQENKQLSDGITERLKQNDKRHEINLAVARAEFAQRLRQSDARSGIYREQANGSTAERERLASHAAQLDRSLEEGRSVVRELRETVELRDEQLRQLGQQILADRALLN